MEYILEIIEKNYIVFIVIALLLIFALIGYLADKKLGKDIVLKKDNLDTLDIPKEVRDSKKTINEAISSPKKEEEIPQVENIDIKKETK